MSHAWNACGFHDPRGFKSHILRQCEVSRHRSQNGASRFFFFTPQPGPKRWVMRSPQDFVRIPKSVSGRGIDQEYGPVLQIVNEKGHFQGAYL